MKSKSIKKLFYLTLIALIFLILAFSLLIFTRTYTENSLNAIQNYQSNIGQLQQDVEQNASLILNYDNTISSLEKISSKTLTFSFIIFPLTLFLLFTFSQYLGWKIIKEKNFIKDFKKDFLKFFFGNLIFLTILGFLVYFLRFNLILLSILSFVWFSALIIYYLNFENLKKLLSQRIYNLTPLILVLFIICLSISFIFFYAYIKVIANDKNFWFLLWLILLLPLKGLVKISLRRPLF